VLDSFDREEDSFDQMKTSKAYADAGVDLGLGNRVKATLPKLLASTHRREVLGSVGGFGGLFALDTRKYKQPVLVSSVDGVGTKLKLAFSTGRHDTIGEDLVNHCVNDIAVLGAEPLFFLDYIGTGRLEPGIFHDIVQGFARGCKSNHCALIGGETAQMPGFYQEGEYDLSGTIVGVVDKQAMLDGPRSVRRKDVLIGMGSSGLHTNGYSLARRICFELNNWALDQKLPGLRGTLGHELMKVHVSYSPVIQSLLARFQPYKVSGKNLPLRQRPIRAFAHITGGGFIDNLPRILPKNLDAIVQKGSWPIPPLFRLLAEHGKLVDDEAYQVFNMGIGMVAVVSPEIVSDVLNVLKSERIPAWTLGEITAGTGQCQVL